MSHRSKTYLVSFFFLFTLLPISASGDQAIQLVRVNCIPEANYFDVEISTHHGLEDIDVPVKSPPFKTGMAKTLAKNGIYFPRKLVYECKLQGATYKIAGYQPLPKPRGQCGASPTPSISLWRNDELWLDSVLFGDDCFGNATVKRIEISRGRHLSLYIHIPDRSLFDPILFQYLAPGEISAKIPIKPDGIDKFIESDYAYKLYKSKTKSKQDGSESFEAR